eukprot:1017136-Amphidinium_carterae.1
MPLSFGKTSGALSMALIRKRKNAGEGCGTERMCSRCESTPPPRRRKGETESRNHSMSSTGKHCVSSFLGRVKAPPSDFISLQPTLCNAPPLRAILLAAVRDHTPKAHLSTLSSYSSSQNLQRRRQISSNTSFLCELPYKILRAMLCHASRKRYPTKRRERICQEALRSRNQLGTKKEEAPKKNEAQREQRGHRPKNNGATTDSGGLGWSLIIPLPPSKKKQI